MILLSTHPLHSFPVATMTCTAMVSFIFGEVIFDWLSPWGALVVFLIGGRAIVEVIGMVFLL